MEPTELSHSKLELHLLVQLVGFPTEEKKMLIVKYPLASAILFFFLFLS